MAKGNLFENKLDDTFAETINIIAASHSDFHTAIFAARPHRRGAPRGDAIAHAETLIVENSKANLRGRRMDIHACGRSGAGVGRLGGACGGRGRGGRRGWRDNGIS